jgi:hypothetical protein
MRHPVPCPRLNPSRYRYLHLYRYQVLIGKEQCRQGVGRPLALSFTEFKEPLRPRRNGRDRKDCVDAQVAGGRLRPIPRRLIPRNDAGLAS